MRKPAIAVCCPGVLRQILRLLVADVFINLRQLGSWLLKSQDTLEVRRLGQVTLAFCPWHNAITRQYYLYWVGLLGENVGNIRRPCNILCGDYRFRFKNNKRTIRVNQQIEHTLVKRGGRDAEGAETGGVAIPGRKGETYLVRLANRRLLERSDVVIEYSRPNIINMRSVPRYRRQLEKTFHIMPLLYEGGPDSAIVERDLDVVTVFGNPNEPYRRRFLEALAAHGVSATNITGHFEDIQLVYRRTRILINVRQTTHHDTLEELRILPALLCGAIVVSERAPFQNKIYYNKFILWGQLEELPALIKHVKENYRDYRQQIFGEGKLARRIARLRRCNALTAIMAARYIDGLLD
jgi:hypothetical protein